MVVWRPIPAWRALQIIPRSDQHFAFFPQKTCWVCIDLMRFRSNLSHPREGTIIYVFANISRICSNVQCCRSSDILMTVMLSFQRTWEQNRVVVPSCLKFETFSKTWTAYLWMWTAHILEPNDFFLGTNALLMTAPCRLPPSRGRRWPSG